MKTILSDIRGNLVALNAVLENIAQHPVQAIYCLSDLVGYGPNPRECVDLAMQWKVVLKGNFDRVILEAPPISDQQLSLQPAPWSGRERNYLPLFPIREQPDDGGIS